MVNLKPLNKKDLPFLLEVRNDDSTRFYLEDNSVSIPVGWWVTPEEREYIVNCIKNYK